MRGDALRSDVRVQFAGHETFPMRLLWPKKAFDAVEHGASSRTFQEPSAIARFGVGRNMAVAMRYWALACGFVEERDGRLGATPMGRAILSENGFDPYVEQAATTWLAHWQIASTPEMTTTAYYAFNVLAGVDFDAVSLAEEVFALAQTRGWRATRNTLKRDVDVFLRSYVRRADMVSEDAAEPLLAELGLVREARVGSWYELLRGPKPSLPDGVFAFALEAFWARSAQGSTVLTAEQVCYDAGSPGRVFKLDEDGVVTRLMAMEALTGGSWRWSDTAGLRQVQRVAPADWRLLLATAYGRDPVETTS